MILAGKSLRMRAKGVAFRATLAEAEAYGVYVSHDVPIKPATSDTLRAAERAFSLARKLGVAIIAGSDVTVFREP